jgi:hypothetical protein
MIAQLDCFRPTGTNDCLAAHADVIRGTPLEPILEPHRFQAPPGYHSTKGVASGLFLLLGQGRIKDQLGLPQVPTQITAHVIACQVIRYGVPVYFVQEGFARAVAATDLPHDFTLNDLHWPLPGMVAGFPAGFMQEYLGRDTCYLYAANCDAGNYHVAALAGCPVITVPKGKVAWQFYAWADGHLESFVTSFLREDAVDETIAKYDYTDYTGLKDEIGIQQDRDVTDRVSALMLKLLVILNTRPGLVETGRCVRPLKMKHGRIKHHELWSPNLIGAHYRMLREGPEGGTHASPRLHWRRGHLTHQFVGGRRSEGFVPIAVLPRREDGEIDWNTVEPELRQKFWQSHRLKWVEPVLIGVDQAAAAERR